MKLTWGHVGLIATGFSAATLGVLIKKNHLETGMVSSGKTDVKLRLSVRGTGGRAVKNAKISVFDPIQIFLGQTNEEGVLNTHFLASSGKSIILQAEGIAFKMQRDLLVPRSAQYQSSVFFDLAEVHEGNATIISSANTETTSLVPVTTPEPDRLEIQFEALRTSDEIKLHLKKNLQVNADKLKVPIKSKLSCQTWDSAPLTHECELQVPNRPSVFRLKNQLPFNETDTFQWLSSFTENQTDELVHPRFGKSETLFSIRHGHQKIRAYLEETPLEVWREKPDTTVFKHDLSKFNLNKNQLELIVLTEHNQVLQRRIARTNSKKIITLRVPNQESLRLSKRKSQN
ncbi:hypothetical protein EBU99_01775 [bacterium]|nr:hypothetical protein [bacterium]